MHSSPQPGAAVEEESEALLLPELRQDLQLIPNRVSRRSLAPAGDWRLYDPLAHRYFELDNQSLAMLAHWHAGSLGALRRQMFAALGYSPEAQQVRSLLEFLQRHDLLRPVAGQTCARLRQQRRAARHSLGSRLLHGYLFFKVPLARPDAFLRRTLPWVRPLLRPGFWWAAGVLGGLGLYLVSRQWEAFLHELPQLFSATGVIAFGLSLVLVKTLHELGHGYAAVHLGARVTSMGVAFVVMTPILYTDTTDAWRLPGRQRVLIDSAGMAVELLVAVLATLAWVFLPEGPWRSAALLLASSSWLMSLAVNLNPLMRFDGYYLFSDLLGIAGLQERSFAMARWWLRERLFAYGDAQPEPLHGRGKWLLVGFALATWVYRFFLFLGIALLVYHYFFKVLGLFLFALEISWFIVLPIARELRLWWRRRRDAGRRAGLLLLVLAGLLLLVLLPLPGTVRIPAVLTAAHQAPAFAPFPARVEAVLVRQGERVEAGQALLSLAAPEIEQQLHASREQQRLLRERLGRGGADAQDLAQSLVLARELRLEDERSAGLLRQRARLLVRAPVAGVVADLVAELSPGRWVDNQTPLASIAEPDALEARGYISADDLRRIRDDANGLFVDEQRLQPARSLRIVRIAEAANETLENWVLASPHGGSVAARLQDGKLRAEQSVFEVAARVTAPGQSLPLTELRGEMQIQGRPASLAGQLLRRIASVLLREAGA